MKPIVPKYGWAFGVPPPIVATPLAAYLGELVTLIKQRPDGRELFIQCAAYSHQTSCENVEAHLVRYHHAPEAVQ